jgi:hypothetical protein
VAAGSTQPGGSGTDPGATSVASTDPTTPPVTGTESVPLLLLAAVLLGLGGLAMLGAARPRRS